MLMVLMLLLMMLTLYLCYVCNLICIIGNESALSFILFSLFYKHDQTKYFPKWSPGEVQVDVKGVFIPAF